jgi:hypothetical protein
MAASARRKGMRVDLVAAGLLLANAVVLVVVG